jgi:hypothetical protein
LEHIWCTGFEQDEHSAMLSASSSPTEHSEKLHLPRIDRSERPKTMRGPHYVFFATVFQEKRCF